MTRAAAPEAAPRAPADDGAGRGLRRDRAPARRAADGDGHRGRPTARLLALDGADFLELVNAGPLVRPRLPRPAPRGARRRATEPGGWPWRQRAPGPTAPQPAAPRPSRRGSPSPRTATPPGASPGSSAAYPAMCGAAKELPVAIIRPPSRQATSTSTPWAPNSTGGSRVVEPGRRVGEVVGGHGDDRREQRRVAVARHVVGRADEQHVGEVGPVGEVVEEPEESVALRREAQVHDRSPPARSPSRGRPRRRSPCPGCRARAPAPRRGRRRGRSRG